MNTKLTLRLDDKLIQSAKQYSAKTGRPLSKIVSDYFSLIDGMAAAPEIQPAPRLTASLLGCLKTRTQEVSEEDYKHYLESKYR